MEKSEKERNEKKKEDTYSVDDQVFISSHKKGKLSKILNGPFIVVQVPD